MDKETKKEFEELGAMIKRGFDGVYKTMDARFTAMDARFDQIRSEFHDEFHSLRLEIKSEINDINTRLDTIEEKLDNVSKMAKEDIEATISDVFDLRQRVEVLESQISMVK